MAQYKQCLFSIRSNTWAIESNHDLILLVVDFESVYKRSCKEIHVPFA